MTTSPIDPVTEAQRTTSLDDRPPSSHAEVLSATEQSPGLGFSVPTLNGGVSTGSQSPSVSSWEGYRMIDVENETSIDSLAATHWGLSAEAEFEL